MKEELIYELLLDRIKKLEEKVISLQNQLNDYIVSRPVPVCVRENRPSAVSPKLRSFIDFLQEKISHNGGHYMMYYSEVKRMLNIEEMSFEEFNRSMLVRKLRTHGNIMLGSVSLKDDPYIEFALYRPVGTDEIKAYIQKKIRESENEYVEIRALHIHKELGLVSRMPTVCRVMTRLMDENTDSIVEGNELTSKYTIKYKKR